MKTRDNAATENVDYLIDMAAAEMTSAVPSSEFSARVMAKLHRAPSRDRRWVASGVVAAAAVVLALWLPRLSNLPQSDNPRANVGPVAPASNHLAAQLPFGQISTSAGRLETSRAIELSADEAAWLSRSVLPLASSPAIAIDAIQPEPSSIAPISVQPLVPEPIELTPLANPSQPNGGR